jgi:hypothetical protein
VGVDAAREIARLEEDCKNLSKAMRKGKKLKSLVAELAKAEDELAKARSNCRHHAQAQADPVLAITREQLDERFKDVLLWLARNSFEFARLLRRLITEFWIQPVQALDSGLVRARARLVVDFARFSELSGIALAKHVSEERVELEFDVFEPPAHIRHLQGCLAIKRENPRMTYESIAKEISQKSGEIVGHMTVKRAFAYAKRMEKEGLTTPYRVLTARPEKASRWIPRVKALPAIPATDPATSATPLTVA